MSMPVRNDRQARYLAWTVEVQTDAGRHAFLQDVKACGGNLVEYSKGRNLPSERVAAFLVEHAGLNEQAKEMLRLYTHQLAADVVALADELVDEEVTPDRREILKAAAKLRSEGRKFLARAWNRPVYGDAVQVQHTGETVVRLTFGGERPAIAGSAVVIDEEDVGI